MKDTIMKVASVLLATAFSCLLFYTAWQESNSPKVELNKSDWDCVQTEVRITNVMIGGKLMPRSKQICVEYRRK